MNDFAANLIDKFDKTGLVVDEGEVKFDEALTSEQLVSEMKFGWNLGNTLDAINLKKKGNNGLDSETCWGNPETKEEIFEALSKKGVKIIRIPVTWRNHLIDNNYTIDSKWIKRIKQVIYRY